MKKLCLWLALASCTLPATVLAGTDVGVSVGIQQPGFYGRIDIGNAGAPPVLVYPQPVLAYPQPVQVYPQPVLIAAPAPRVVQRPIYMHVPPGHAKDWRRYCSRYGACAKPVYFVRDDWYHQHYDDHGRGRGKGHHRHDR